MPEDDPKKKIEEALNAFYELSENLGQGDTDTVKRHANQLTNRIEISQEQKDNEQTS